MTNAVRQALLIAARNRGAISGKQLDVIHICPCCGSEATRTVLVTRPALNSATKLGLLRQEGISDPTFLITDAGLAEIFALLTT